MTKPLSDAQLRALTAAADQPDRILRLAALSPRPRGASRQKLVASLLEKGLLEEAPTDNPELAWRQDEQDQPQALRVADAGLRAIGREPEEPFLQSNDTATADGRPSGKLGLILAAIEAEQGASLAELIRLTGWLPHTTRAALSRLRQRGYALQLTRTSERSAYRLVPRDS